MAKDKMTTTNTLAGVGGDAPTSFQKPVTVKTDGEAAKNKQDELRNIKGTIELGKEYCIGRGKITLNAPKDGDIENLTGKRFVKVTSRYLGVNSVPFVSYQKGIELKDHSVRWSDKIESPEKHIEEFIKKNTQEEQ